jgi:hypothetical protein
MMLQLMTLSILDTASLQIRIRKCLLFSPSMDQLYHKPPRAESPYVGYKEVYNVIAKEKDERRQDL